MSFNRLFRAFSVLPTLAGALRAFRTRRISQHPANRFAGCLRLRLRLGFRSRHALRHSDCLNVLSFSVLPTVAGGAFHALSKANFATPCKQICRVSAFTPAAFAPQSFLSPPCFVAVLYGDPVYGFRFTPQSVLASRCSVAVLCGEPRLKCLSIGCFGRPPCYQRSRGAPRGLVQGELRNTLQKSPAGCLHQRLRLLPRKVSSLRVAPLRYFTGNPV